MNDIFEQIYWTTYLKIEYIKNKYLNSQTEQNKFLQRF